MINIKNGKGESIEGKPRVGDCDYKKCIFRRI